LLRSTNLQKVGGRERKVGVKIGVIVAKGVMGLWGKEKGPLTTRRWVGGSMALCSEGGAWV